MQRTLIALSLVAAGYLLGTLRTPAQADDSGKVADLLSSIERSQRTIADATRTIARSSERCAR